MQAETSMMESRSERAKPAEAEVDGCADELSCAAVRLQRDLETICTLGARELEPTEVERSELITLLERVLRDLELHQHELSLQLAVGLGQVQRESWCARLMHKHVERCCDSLRAEVSRLLCAARRPQPLAETFRTCWACALAMRIELGALRHDVLAVVATLHSEPGY